MYSSSFDMVLANGEKAGLKKDEIFLAVPPKKIQWNPALRTPA